MSDDSSDRSNDQFEQAQSFQNEARKRAAVISGLGASESKALQSVGRLFTEFRSTRNLSHKEISERTGVEPSLLRLLEEGFLTSDELSRAFLAQVGTAFVSSNDRLAQEEGGAFAAIASSILEAGAWVGSEAAAPEVERLIALLTPETDNGLREEAVRSLGEHALNPIARDALAGALRSDGFLPVRMAALEALAGSSPEPEVRSALVARLADSDPVVRSRVVEILKDSIPESPSGLERTLSKLISGVAEASEAVLERFRHAVSRVPSASLGIQLEPRLEGAAAQSLIAESVDIGQHRADLIMNGNYPEFELALGITFTDALAWAGHYVRIQFASDVEERLTDAGWRIDWAGFGPDSIDSEIPVSAFGRIETKLGTTSRSGSDRESASQRGPLENLVAVVAAALGHDFAISRLNSDDPGR
ncbi:MAG: HEAT repeat domain-containing protein [SAR202 cluster bacterium]|jgi:transcriptional regulator with XRE-family HTH domain|nr:HEAT repeat domain-containing protein [SAR202 cluster bacterium]MDP6714869.1 HEAT repeat domain-containing protein [SAR202 cluster bacterium]